jgi:hypothetical protein
MASISPDTWRPRYVGFSVDALMIVVRDAWTRALRETGESRLSRLMAYAYANGEDLIDDDAAKAQFGRGELPEPPELKMTITPMPRVGSTKPCPTDGCGGTAVCRVQTRADGSGVRIVDHRTNRGRTTAPQYDRAWVCDTCRLFQVFQAVSH